MRLFRVVVLGLVCLAVTPRAASAATPKERAGELFRAGNEAFGQGEYQDALDKFEQARKLYPSYRIDLNIASALKELGRTVEAAEAYQSFLSRGSSLAPAEIVKAARSSLEAVQAQVGRVLVSSPQPGATVEVDGKTVGQTPLDRWIYLEPGSHMIRMCKEGFVCTQEEVSFSAGDRKELQLSLGPKVASESTRRVDEPLVEPAPPVEPEPSPARDRVRWKATAGWITLGVGGAALVTGIVFGAMASSKADDHADAVAQGQTYSELEEIKSEGERYETIGIATAVVGGVALAAGGGLLLWHYLGRRERAQASEAAIVPMVGRELTGLAGIVRF